MVGLRRKITSRSVQSCKNFASATFINQTTTFSWQFSPTNFEPTGLTYGLYFGTGFLSRNPYTKKKNIMKSRRNIFVEILYIFVKIYPDKKQDVGVTRVRIETSKEIESRRVVPTKF